MTIKQLSCGQKRHSTSLWTLETVIRTHFIVSQANDKQINQLLGSSHRFVQQSGKNLLSKHDACMYTLNRHYVLKERSMILFGVNFQRNSDHLKLWSVQFGLSECDTKLLKLLTFWVVGNDSESGMSHVTVTLIAVKKSFCLSRRHSSCVKIETGNFSPKLVIKKKNNSLFAILSNTRLYFAWKTKV